MIYSLRNIFQAYGGRPALQVNSLDLPAGSITGVIGPNGGGKSTFMRLLAFLESPLSGHIFFNGERVEELSVFLRKQVTLLTQEPYLLHRTVGENVAYGLSVRGENECGGKVAQALEAVGLMPEEFLHRQWFELSGGEAQRVALAARLVLKPRVLLLDEPTASVDEESAERIRAAALDLRDGHGTTLVIVSHDKDWVTSVAEHTITIRNGILTE